jgi:DNA repair protein RadC
MDTKSPQKNIHAGHRKRMREQMQKSGLYNLSDVHFLEYLLTFVIKRADTNPIAHSLLNEFGSIKHIFNASTFALTQIKGVGKQTAEFLKFMELSAHMYNKSNAKEQTKLDTLRKMVKYITAILPPSDNEQFVVIILNKNYTVKDYKVFNGVSHSFITIDKNELTEYLINHKASFVLFAHTHPNHDSKPSLSDITTFETITPLINALSIVLVDNIIIGENNYYSLKNAAQYAID